MDLNKGEAFFIDVYRKFEFLRKLNYTGKDFCLNGREYWITFENLLLKRKITIILEEPLQFNIYFERQKWFVYKRQHAKFSIKELYDIFNYKYLDTIGLSKKIEKNANFIQQHLMSVIKGEMWINEILK